MDCDLSDCCAAVSSKLVIEQFREMRTNSENFFKELFLVSQEMFRYGVNGAN